MSVIDSRDLEIRLVLEAGVPNEFSHFESGHSGSWAQVRSDSAPGTEEASQSEF